MIITLCGFMGCGKSTLGRGLAQACSCRFIDLDDYIEDKWAMKVPTIFEKRGEEWFRNEECNCLNEIIEEYNYLNSKNPYNLVVALGGGTVTSEQSAAVVREHTTCVYLECPKETLLRRLVKNNSRRPLLAGKSEEEISASIDSLMQRREEIYRTSAHHIYHTSGKRMMEVIGDFRGRFGV